VNFCVVVPWPWGGDKCSDKFGVRVGRFQFLPAIEDASDKCVGLSYVIRARDSYRAEDVVARLGGEEFVLLMPDTSLEEAHRRAEALRRDIAETPVVLEDGPLSVTVSVGVVRRGDAGTLAGLLHAADQAMYAAKAAGRNRVVVAG
jgi:diguanylate cyclase (GGDEF)-like protein